jgi:ATP-dependent Lhr-like helicase
MAEWLRRLGDLMEGELEGPSAGFVRELAADGRVRRIELPGCPDGVRWVLTEQADQYAHTFGMEEASAEQRQAAGEKILERFLASHALVGLSDILKRYPFERTWAQRQLEEWSRKGRIMPVPRGDVEPMQWSAPVNLEQARRATLALLRREVTTCPAAQFVDFVLHWQGLYRGAGQPATTTADSPTDLLASVLMCLQALHLPVDLWEQTVLPARVPGYQTRWLDDLIASGQWSWTCRQDGLAFVLRDSFPELAPPSQEEIHLDAAAESVLECLRRGGAQFVDDLARDTGLSPGVTRAGLWSLMRTGLVANDRFDVIRMNEGREKKASDQGSDEPRPSGSRSLMVARRRRGTSRPEGRWSLLPWARPDVETQAFFLAGVLLQRYGIVARELALLDAGMLPWRVLYEVLSRMELAGKVRRGYFVEGLSGAQFALPEAARLLQEMAVPSTAAAPVILLHSQDPANLFGSGAPFAIPLGNEEIQALTRRLGNWLVLRAGRPVLIIEQQGSRLTALPGTRDEELAAAVACLPRILDQDRSLAARRKITVTAWNGQSATASEGRELLEAVGFVRDYQSMTLYGAWR